MTDGGTALVVGASRGIGLELVRQYAAAGWSIHATTRGEAGALGEIPGALQVHPLEVTDSRQIEALVDGLPQRGLAIDER